MKIVTKIVTIATLIGAGTSMLSAGEKTGEEIFKASCVDCHAVTYSSKMVAPPIMGAVNQVKMKYEDRDAAVKFIADYIRNPTKEKSASEYGAIKEFGLMPSQKSTVSEEDSLKVAEYVYDNFGRGGYGGRGYGRGRGQYGNFGRGGYGRRWHANDENYGRGYGRGRGQYGNFGRGGYGGRGYGRGRGGYGGRGYGRGRGQYDNFGRGGYGGRGYGRGRFGGN